MGYYSRMHNARVTVPFSVSLFELSDYLGEGCADSLEGLGFKDVDFTVCITDNPPDMEVGDPGGAELSDWWIGCVPERFILYRDNITKAVAAYIGDNEDLLLSDTKTSDAFESFYEMADMSRSRYEN